MRTRMRELRTAVRESRTAPRTRKDQHSHGLRRAHVFEPFLTNQEAGGGEAAARPVRWRLYSSDFFKFPSSSSFSFCSRTMRLPCSISSRTFCPPLWPISE